eukprot:CAMPEP_0185186388 /NCGR_PEP_ID=MMETSP1140-20130426/4005_1 /TAXON_ID=298111 /ORGANISM="Pavlova sp., Strain CCMP459" /LENGTH=109 /DNA_ID=CAMNT_0027752679 /DNA_START=63 /DNA_END=392 /DNA_ORIENTATION=-
MKLVAAVMCASLAAVSGFAVPAVSPAGPTISRVAVSAPESAVVMRCRTNTKREKFFRNLENAKRFRKSSWKPYKSKAVVAEEDTAMLSTIYVTTDSNGEALEAAEETSE